jgi:hypothetical protein
MSDSVATPATPPAAPAAPETFSREYVSELRGENKGLRLKAQEMEQRAKAAEEAATAKATAAEAAAAEAVKTATEAAQTRIMTAELKAAALKAGMIDMDGLKLADLSTVKLNDNGELEGADALMTALKESKPYLFKETKSTSSTGKPPKGDTKPSTFRDLTPEQQNAELRRRGVPV